MELRIVCGKCETEYRISDEKLEKKATKFACKKCGQCAAVCPYGAIIWQKGEVARVVQAACAGCGNCGAACPFGAITMRHFTDDQYVAQVRATLGLTLAFRRG